ncbi:hypothetical protein Tco_1148971, partial [Tanacetum coccineum]
MGDVNPIRTLGDYSKPSHEGYRNTIELSIGNNVVHLRSDTIRLVQNRCLFHGYQSEDSNQHLKDFLKLAHLEKKRTRLRTNTKTLEDLCSQSLETALQAIHDAVTTHQVTVSHHFMMVSARTDLNADLEDSSHDGVTTKTQCHR